jgi:zinc transport system substrate-binding protein
MIWLLLLLPGVFFFSGCNRRTSSDDTGEPQATQRIVLATVYPMADIARDVGGSLFDVKWLCENGQDPRDLKLTDEQDKLAHRADLIITSGFRETWAGEMLGTGARTRGLLLLDATSTGRALPDDHAALWLDPQIAKEAAEEIRQRASVWDSRNDALYRSNADRVIKSLNALDADYRKRLAPHQGKSFVSLRPLWGQLADRYGLREVAPIIATPQTLTDDDVRAIKQAAKEAETDLLVTDATFLPGIQRELQLRTGLRLLPLDPLGSSAPDGRSTYVKLMQFNLDQLLKAFEK